MNKAKIRGELDIKYSYKHVDFWELLLSKHLIANCFIENKTNTKSIKLKN